MKPLLLSLLLAGSLVAPAQTGPEAPEFAMVERAVTALLAKYQIPGAAVAIAKDRRLVYTRGFGIADVTTNEPVQPDSLFRVASVSKPITAIAVMKLVEEGKVSLDTKVLAYVGRTAAADPRYADITVRHLLQHSAGLDLEFWGFDPTFPDRETLQALEANLPPDRAAVLDFILENLPLASAPGERYSYSNVGFLLLTDVIEKAAGQRYESYMREKILAPLGIQRMRIAGSLLTERQPGEVRYWDKDRTGPSIFAGLPEESPSTYGTFHLRIFESGGGWLASMPDLARLLVALDAGTLLRPETVRLITERPAYVRAGVDSWYGLGWGIVNTRFGLRWDHDGALPGTAAWMFRGLNGVSFAIAANHLPDVERLQEFFDEVQTGLTNTVLATPAWPAGDLFPAYFPGAGPRVANAGVVNAATLRPGPVAAGSAVTLFGVNLAGQPVRVNGTLVEPLWSEPDRLTVQVPPSAQGVTRFEVGNSRAETVTVRNSAPGIFTTSRNGYGAAAALNQDGSVNSVERPAAPGSVVVLYATGADAQPTVTVGGLPAAVLYAGPAPGLPAGIQQLNLRLPASLPPGAALVSLGAPAEVTVAVR
jgi:uncharacterized protein (TIGR03437 family)